MPNLLNPEDIEELIFNCADHERNVALPIELRLSFSALDYALTNLAIRLRDYKSCLEKP